MLPATSSGIAAVMVAISYLTIHQYKDHQKLASRQDIDDIDYDFIIVGGGTAGSVVASRLSENPNVKVLILEEGGPETVATDIPALDLFSIASPELATTHWLQPQENACLAFPNHSIPVKAPKILGGASTVNGMVYNRGGSDDFNGWARDHNCTGWSYEEVLPYFKKSEDNKDPVFASQTKYHSTNGLLSVVSMDLNQSAKTYKIVTDAFVSAAHQLGYKTVDLNSEGENQIGLAVSQRTISKGRRHSSASAFLLPFASRSNLHILTRAKVIKVLFGKGAQTPEARGVEFIHKGLTRRVFASGEIILSAGALNSPKILLLSGIGPAEDLKKLGIPLVADLPVGQMLQDHVRVSGLDWTVNTKVFTSPTDLLTEDNLALYYINETGPLSNTIYAHQGAFLNLRTGVGPPKNVKGALFGPADVNVEPTLTGSPVGILTVGDDTMSDDIKNKYYGPHIGENVVNIVLCLNHVKSRGYLKLRSKDPEDLPLVDPRYLTDKDGEDINRLIDAFITGMKFENTSAFQALGAKPYPQVLPGCEGFLPKSGRKYVECVIRHLTGSELHFGSSCKMGGYGDEGATVDPRLRVQGVDRLRVVDASIMPFLTSSNIMTPVIMIGEKGADMIKEDNEI